MDRRRFILYGASAGLMSRFPQAFAVPMPPVLDSPASSGPYSPTHYVTANANGSGNGSQGSPWTLTQAMQNATSGDVVQVGPGAYINAGASVDATSPVFRPSNDGTPDSPIIFFAQYPAATTNDRSLWSMPKRPNNGPAGYPILGAGGVGSYKNNIVFDGFAFDYNDGAYPFTRGICYAGFDNSGVVFRRMRFIRSNLGAADDGDNFNCIHVHGSRNLTISDCLFEGGRDANGSHNESCITLYGATGFLIEHNTFRNVTTGMYVKGSFSGRGNSGNIRFNLMTGFCDGMELTENNPGESVEVYQNLFYNWGQAGRRAINYENSVSSRQTNFRVHHNTVVMPANPSGGGIELESGIAMTSNVCRDNIVACSEPNNQVLVNAWGINNLNPFSTFDYNWYYNNGNAPTYAIGGSVYSGLSAWRNATGRDINSVVANPQFQNPSNNDYRLAASSPARTASSTGGPVGCYITGNEEMGIRPSPPY